MTARHALVRAVLVRAVLVRAAAGCLAVGALTACVPSAPDDQTTDVDVARYHELAADPWLAATDLTVGRYAFGTNGLFEAGSGLSARTTSGTLAQVLAGETAAAAQVGWVVVAARCTEGSDAALVVLARELSDGAVAAGTIGVEQSRLEPGESVADVAEGELAGRVVPRRVQLAAYVPHHTVDAELEVPTEPVPYESLTCLGGSGGGAVGSDDLLTAVQAREGGRR